MSNLGYSERDSFSRYLPLPLTGLLGPVKWAKENHDLEKYKKKNK